MFNGVVTLWSATEGFGFLRKEKAGAARPAGDVSLELFKQLALLQVEMEANGMDPMVDEGIGILGKEDVDDIFFVAANTLQKVTAGTAVKFDVFPDPQRSLKPRACNIWRADSPRPTISGRARGVVKCWQGRPKNFGFVLPSAGGREIFCHETSLNGLTEVTPGSVVSFETEWDNVKQRPRTRDVCVEVNAVLLTDEQLALFKSSRPPEPPAAEDTQPTIPIEGFYESFVGTSERYQAPPMPPRQFIRTKPMPAIFPPPPPPPDQLYVPSRVNIMYLGSALPRSNIDVDTDEAVVIRFPMKSLNTKAPPVFCMPYIDDNEVEGVKFLQKSRMKKPKVQQENLRPKVQQRSSSPPFLRPIPLKIDAKPEIRNPLQATENLTAMACKRERFNEGPLNENFEQLSMMNGQAIDVDLEIQAKRQLKARKIEELRKDIDFDDI